MKWSVTGLPREKGINTTLAYINEFPHQAFIVIVEASDVKGEAFTIKGCGSAVLIDKNWLLTAAHVMLNKGPFTRRGPFFKIILGVDKFEQAGIIVQARSYKCHPGFLRNKSFFYNDICLVKTQENIHFSNRVRPVALPNKNEESTYYQLENGVMLSGFAITLESRQDSFYGGLRQVLATIMPAAFCNQGELFICTLRHAKLEHGWAGFEGHPHMEPFADSGSGLVSVRDKSGELVLLGILSSEEGLHLREENDLIEYYVKVSHYLDWIHSETWS